MFGPAVRSEFLLDPELVYLNHGTVGVPPRRVLEARRRIAESLERNPSRSVLREMSAVGVDAPEGFVPLMRQAAVPVARFLGVRPDDLVFVDNATTGINAILRSFPFVARESIAVTALGYGSIDLVAQYVARQRGLSVYSIELPFAVESPGALVDAFRAGLPPDTRLVVIDHICSASGIQWPIEEMVAVAKANGTVVVVDGAHAPGCIPLDIASIGADYYVANLHKWAFAPRSSAILWAPPERQEGLHPTVISWGFDQGFTTEFDFVGTRDPSAHLAAPEGLAMLEEWGLDAVLAHNGSLVLEGAKHVADAVGGALLHPESMATCMAAVRLPERYGQSFEAMRSLCAALLYEDRIEVAGAFREGRISLRLAAQVYNGPADFEALGRALAAR